MQISNTERNVPYTKQIERTLNNEILSLPSDEWIQFLLDHREELLKRSTHVALTEEVMYRYRYRILDYLHDVHGHTQGADQAFRIINRFHSDMDFDLDLKECWVPSREQLTQYRSSYQTNLVRQKKLG